MNVHASENRNRIAVRTASTSPYSLRFHTDGFTLFRFSGGRTEELDGVVRTEPAPVRIGRIAFALLSVMPFCHSAFPSSRRPRAPFHKADGPPPPPPTPPTPSLLRNSSCRIPLPSATSLSGRRARPPVSFPIFYISFSYMPPFYLARCARAYNGQLPENKRQLVRSVLCCLVHPLPISFQALLFKSNVAFSL